MLPDPIPYSESESLSLWQCFCFLVSFFLITFLSWFNFSLNCGKYYFVGLGFFPPFLAARKSGFSVLSYSNQWQSLVLCNVYTPPCFLQRSQCFLAQAFLGTLAVVLLPGCFAPFFSLCKAFLLGEELDLSWLHTLNT